MTARSRSNRRQIAAVGVIPGDRAASLAGGVDVPYEVKQHVAKVIRDQIPDDDERRPILAALFQPPRPLLPAGGVYKTHPHRASWLASCRKWLREQGYVLVGSNVPAELRRKYEAATGDMYEGTE